MLLTASPAAAMVEPLTYVSAAKGQADRAELRVDGALMVQLTCSKRGWLLMRYFDHGELGAILPRYRSEPMGLILDDPGYGPDQPGKAGFKITVVSKPARDGLAGDIRLTPQIVKLIERSRDLMIYAPNEMGEAFSAGSSAPLKQLVRTCDARQGLPG